MRIILGTFIFILLWEILACFSSNAFLAPHFDQIFLRFAQDYKLLSHHLFLSLKEMFFAILWAAVLAFPLGYGMFRFSIVRMLLQPFFLLFQSLPTFVLAPLFVVWLGWTMKVVVIPTVIMIVFPLAMHVYRGLIATPRDHLDFFTVHQASGWQIFWKLRFYFSLPSLFSGLRIAAAIAAMGVIAGEWVGGQEGLGIFMQECRFNFDVIGIYASIICLILITFSFYGLITSLEKWALRRLRFI